MGSTPTPTLASFAGERAEHYPLSREAGEGWGGGLEHDDENFYLVSRRLQPAAALATPRTPRASSPTKPVTAPTVLSLALPS